MSERLAYTDTWDRGIDSFLDMLYRGCSVMRRLAVFKRLYLPSLRYETSPLYQKYDG